jgi:hypothetical protein
MTYGKSEYIVLENYDDPIQYETVQVLVFLHLKKHGSFRCSVYITFFFV